MNKGTKQNKNHIYRLHVLNDSTHESVFGYRFRRYNFIITIASCLLLFVLIIFSLIAYTPLRNLVPGYPSGNASRVAIQNAIKIDSLETMLRAWDIYSKNISYIINEENTVNIDSVLNIKGKEYLSEEEIKVLEKQDSILREKVKKEEQFNISNKKRELSIEGLRFFTPLKGVVTQKYDKAVHPSIDITAPKNSLIMAVLDGTVFYTGWSNDTGYTIQIQHSGDIISIYKHNAKLLKKIGDKVTAGTAIALMGNTGETTTGDHLHFELWYKGESVDPGKYINF